MSAERQELAYELYKTLGSERTHAKVADLMGLKLKTIETWSYKNKWKERLDLDYKAQTEQLREKSEQLQLLGIDTALAALGLIKQRIESGKLGKETAQTFEVFLRTPLEVIGGGTVNEQSAGDVNEQSAGDVNGGKDKEKIEIIFDINGGVSSED